MDCHRFPSPHNAPASHNRYCHNSPLELNYNRRCLSEESHRVTSFPCREASDCSRFAVRDWCLLYTARLAVVLKWMNHCCENVRYSALPQHQMPYSVCYRLADIISLPGRFIWCLWYGTMPALCLSCVFMTRILH